MSDLYIHSPAFPVKGGRRLYERFMTLLHKPKDIKLGYGRSINFELEREDIKRVRNIITRE